MLKLHKVNPVLPFSLFSKLVFDSIIQLVAVALFLAVFGADAALAQTRAYVTNGFNNNVSVIDTVAAIILLLRQSF